MKEEIFVEDYKISEKEANLAVIKPTKYECPWCGYIGTASVNLRITDTEPEANFGPFCMVCIGKFLERNFTIMKIVEERKDNGE